LIRLYESASEYPIRTLGIRPKTVGGKRCPCALFGRRTPAVIWAARTPSRESAYASWTRGALPMARRSPAPRPPAPESSTKNTTVEDCPEAAAREEGLHQLLQGLRAVRDG